MHPNRGVGSRGASGQFIPGVEPAGQRLAGCHLATPPKATTPLYRSGLPTILRGTMPSADFCGAVREDSSTLSPLRGDTAGLPRSAVRPSVHRRRMYQVRPSCGWRTLWSRAHSSRASHTSYPVRVPRPAPSFHAAFRPHLTVTPLRVPCPSAPRTPGQGDFHPHA
jgi:hypothetical protein